MINIEDYLFDKIVSIMQQWEEKDIYLIIFFIYKNEKYNHENHMTAPSFSILYNTESYFQSIYDKKQNYYEQRYNYAYSQQQNEYEIFDEKTLKIFFEWYNENCFQTGYEYLKLMDILEKVGLKIQQNKELEKLFNKKMPIIIQSIEESNKLRKITQTINFHNEANEYLNYQIDSTFTNINSLVDDELIGEMKTIEKEMIKQLKNNKLFEQGNKKLKRQISRNGESLAFDIDNNLIYVATVTRVYVYKLSNYEILFELKVFKDISDIFLSHNKTLLAIKNAYGHIAVVEVKTKNIVYKDNLERNSDKIFFSCDDKYIYASNDYGEIHKIDIFNNKFVAIDFSDSEKNIIKIKNGVLYYDDKEDVLCYFWNKEMIIMTHNGKIILSQKITSNIYKGIMTYRNWAITKKYIVLCEEDLVSKNQHLLIICNRKTLKKMKQVAINGGYECLVSDDEKYIAVTGFNRTDVYELNTLLKLKEYHEFPWVLSFQHLSKNKEIYIGSEVGVYTDYID